VSSCTRRVNLLRVNQKVTLARAELGALLHGESELERRGPRAESVVSDAICPSIAASNSLCGSVRIPFRVERNATCLSVRPLSNAR